MEGLVEGSVEGSVEIGAKEGATEETEVATEEMEVAIGEGEDQEGKEVAIEVEGEDQEEVLPPGAVAKPESSSISPHAFTHFLLAFSNR